MIFETFILAGLAKLGCIVTAVKITKWKKQTGKMVKKEKKPTGQTVNKTGKT